MLSPRAQVLRASVVVIAVLAAATGCGATAPDASPPIAAAAARVEPELAISDLLPAFEWPDAAPATTAPSTVAPATALVATTTAPVEAVIGDPRGAEAMALITFAWRQTLPGWSIAFLPARVQLRGLTRVDERRIEIYVRDGDSPMSLARVVAHELGHAVDVELNSPSDRERWRTVRGVAPSVQWWPGNAVSDFDTLAGDFAEAFATWLTGSVSLSRVAPAPDPAALAVLKDLAVS